MRVLHVRKRPVEVLAVRVGMPWKYVAEWCGGTLIKDGNRLSAILIETLEGKMLAHEGDYIIRGVEGEFYPCAPDIFEQTYDVLGEVGRVASS